MKNIEKSVNHQFREVAKMIPHEEVSVSEMQQFFQPVTDCHWLNAAATREACADIAEYAKTAACHTEDAHLLGYLNQIERWAEAALSAQPRNCDVRTAEEQFERFDRWCNSKSIKDCWGLGCRKCLVAWSQMQYEEEKK